MASKAYVASMTVAELKDELKIRGLSTRGSKKALRDRLEQVGVQKALGGRGVGFKVLIRPHNRNT